MAGCISCSCKHGSNPYITLAKDDAISFIRTMQSFKLDTTLNTSIGETTNQRYVYIDALRGVAAAWVLIHHLRHNGRFEHQFDAVFGGKFPLLLDKFFIMGSAGVEIFFVLSGFVIAHCLNGRKVNAKGVGQFSGRRLVRLILPYWFAISVVLIITLKQKLAVPAGASLTFSMREMLANATLTYPYTGNHPYLPVAWTLIIELQFYLFFVILCWFSANLSRDGRSPLRITIPLTLVTGIISIIWIWATDYRSHNSFFLSFWIFFVSGAICYWHHKRYLSFRTSLSCLLTLLTISFVLWESRMVLGTLASISILAASRVGGLTTWLKSQPYQFLGYRSYSIYLIHFPILTAANAWVFSSQQPTMSRLIIAHATALTASFILAEISYRLVEIPAIRLSHRFASLPRVQYPESEAIKAQDYAPRLKTTNR
jgi:peptidoglycan/LPS O-acetylase OafA/YrhL